MLTNDSINQIRCTIPRESSFWLSLLTGRWRRADRKANVPSGENGKCLFHLFPFRIKKGNLFGKNEFSVVVRRTSVHELPEPSLPPLSPLQHPDLSQRLPRQPTRVANSYDVNRASDLIGLQPSPLFFFPVRKKRDGGRVFLFIKIEDPINYFVFVSFRRDRRPNVPPPFSYSHSKTKKDANSMTHFWSAT